MSSKKNNNAKLWGGRFTQATSHLVDEFNASVSFDQRLAPYDIQQSIAHARMLGRQKIIKVSEANQIVAGLKKIDKLIAAGKFKWKLSLEDVHLNIEAKLIQMIGPVGGKLHTARSRNDQVATDLRLYARDHTIQVIELLKHFQSELIKLAEKNLDTLLPGYTHLQRAQPISLGHHLLAFVEMAARDQARLSDALKRLNQLPLGAGALAGTTFPIDRKWVAKELGFAGVCQNSLDAVSDRDFVVELLADLSLTMVHLSRLAEEWILWASQEFGFIDLPENFCTGSSMMPQKINPDILELIRGKSGRVIGALQSLLVLLKGLPLTYNKDMQEDKEPLFDAFKTVEHSLTLLNAMLPATRFHKESMHSALSAGFVLATDLADYLVTLGVPFRDSHRIVGKIVSHCQKLGAELKDLDLKTLQSFETKITKQVYEYLDESTAVNRRQSLGGTALKNVLTQIRQAKQRLKRKI